MLAIELMCAAQGIDYRAPLKPGRGVARAHAAVRALVAPLERDRVLSRRHRAARARDSVRRDLAPPWPADECFDDDRRARGAPARASIRAPRGTTLSCKGWQQEAALRMLMNNLDPEVAERPDDLVVYGGTGQAARSWEAFDAIVAALRALENDETLLVQSGKPVGVFRTHAWAPRVLIANCNLVGRWANVGVLPRARARRADHVRPDDRRLVDLHRLAGHPAGHVRDVRRGRAHAFRRHRSPGASCSPRASAAWAARSRSPRR